MKLVPKIQQVTEIKQNQKKRAVDHFKRCPLCGDADMIVSAPELVCSKCAWTSAEWSVAHGRMDNIWSAIHEDRVEAERERANRVSRRKPAPVRKLDKAIGE